MKIHKISAFIILSFGLAFFGVAPVGALGSPEPNQSGSTGLQGTIPSPPPKTAATISNPTSGRTFTTTPITVTGLCTTGLVVKIFSNNIFMGAAQCANGSYSLQIDLLGGENTLIARVYDALDQQGPDSNSVVVTFSDGQFAAFGQRISLTSTIAKNGAQVGTILGWPIVLSGGTGPYALTVDWGDGTSSDLKSISFAGQINLNHTYKNAGIYRVIVKATDSTGAAAFLQLVGVGMGKVGQNGETDAAKKADNSEVKYIYIWWPVVLIIPFALVAFWVGRRYALLALHRQIEQQDKAYQNEIQR